MIVEAVIFNDELELLEARFHEGENHVDQWIIIESPETFTGKSKALSYLVHRERFDRWNDRVSRVEGRPGMAGTAWGRERAQRDLLAVQLQELPGDAVVALCDADELIASESWDAITELTMGGNTVTFPMRQHYFTLCWATPNARPPDGGVMKRSRAARARSIPTAVGAWADTAYVLELATGWHLSCLGGPERLLQKLKSFSHTELSGPEWANYDNCVRMIRDGIDIAAPTRDWSLTKVEPQGPEWLLTEGVKRWPYLIDGGV